MDWKTFYFKYHLELDGLFSYLISIAASREASLNLFLSPNWRDQLDRLNRVRSVYGTTALEGNPLSEAEVSHQIEILEKKETTSSTSENITKEQLQIRNAGRAQLWVKERFKPDSAPLSLGDILTIHKMVTEHSDTKDNIPGKLRNFPVKVGDPSMGGDHRGAPHEKLQALMKKYIEFVTTPTKPWEDNPVIKALLAHFFLVTIHPFGDGNGRVSRLVEAGILYKHGYNVHGFYGLSNYFYRNEREYKTSLQKCRAKQPFEVTPFIRFGIIGFATELVGINNFIKNKINRVVYRTMLVRAYNKKIGERRRLLNQREYDLLDFLLAETEPIDPFSESSSREVKTVELLKNKYIQAAYKGRKPRTFFRELTRLARHGFIKFRKDGPTEQGIIELDFGAIAKYET
ncbi:MAG: Fic family protein [Acidobacteria bacterium]|nr:Fic family protein [Acidobacteriota bacterium]MBI3656012.1 Fic family protein [Acidobacteriota bacterium]